MALTQNEVPPLVALAGNPMWVKFTTNQTGQSFIGIHITVEEYVDSQWITLGQPMRFEPDSDGVVEVDIHAVLDWKPKKKFSWPEDPNTILTRRNDLRREYRIKAEEKYGNPLSTNDTITTSSLFSLPGKISDLWLGRLNDQSKTWKALMDADYFYLNNSLRERGTDPWASERLYYYRTGTGASSLNMKVKVTYTDASTKEITRATYGTFAQHDVFEIVTSFSTLGLFFLDPSKVIEKYEIWLTNDSSTIISETFTYLVDHQPYDNRRYFLFSNGYKMIEGVRFIGRSKSETELMHTVLNKFLGKGYGVRDSSMEKKQVLETEFREVHSGWLSRDELNWIRELTLSAEVYEIFNGQPVPVMVEMDSTQIHDDNDNLHSLTLVYRYAHSDSIPSFLPEVEDVIANFKGSTLPLSGITNGGAGSDFDALTFTFPQSFLEVTVDDPHVPTASGNDSITKPCVPILVYFNGKAQDLQVSYLICELIEATYTVVSFNSFTLAASDEEGFGILLTESASFKLGITSQADENGNNISTYIHLYVPTKRCLEYLYEQAQ